MPVFDCRTPEGRAEGIAKAAQAARSGRLVVLPTDTLYGIGCDAFDHAAVQALLDAKGRGREMPPPVLVAEPRTVDGLAIDVPDFARALVDAFWPGPLTLILTAQPSLHWDLGDTNGTVAVRMPDDEVALALLTEVGPMAVSSANRTGHPAARDVLDAATQLGVSVQVYLDAGPVRGGLPSTIVDCTGSHPVVLREGALATAQILEVASVEEHQARHAAPVSDAEPERLPHDVEPDGSIPGDPLELPRTGAAPEEGQTSHE